MLNSLLAKLFGTEFERQMKSMGPIVTSINELESTIKSLSDEQLAAQTGLFKGKLEQGAGLDDILPEVFATVRETAWRTLGMRHFDVQLIGGMVLHNGRIAEMKTGEGKTLVATLSVYLNALSGKGVHVVTVNDYLAQRDSEWMGQVYRFLGMDVGVIQSALSASGEDRMAAYRADITYGTNNEFGFDYLRDNMKFESKDKMQRGHNYAIVDEVDSILIDEARTPLIIAGPSNSKTDQFYAANLVIPRLSADTDYDVEEKHRSASLTEEGIIKAEEILKVDNLYDPAHIEILHALNQALVAHSLYKLDQQYVIKDGQVVIVDEFTGRTMEGRRWSDGLHQAVEAKEGVKIEQENQTLATVTFQNYFRMYDKLAGMTGTADTEASEFENIYKLAVTVIPTNKPLIRKDENDHIYKTEREKFDAIIDDIKERHEYNQPILVGTTSIDNSVRLSNALKKRGIKHNVLNAKFHEREAEIVSQAGRLGMVTVATNMAGRGTDIMLGGNPEALALHEAAAQGAEHPDYKEMLKAQETACAAEKQEVLDAGGLHIIGTERHESRRIDNQLRGRSGRQGDPGSSRFYLALDDDLLRIFGGDRLKGWMDKIGLPDGEPIEHKMISKQIEKAQTQVETKNFEARKHLLEYDDVMNKQRVTIYTMREQFLQGETRKWVSEKTTELLSWLLDENLDEKGHLEDWDLERMGKDLKTFFGVEITNLEEMVKALDREELRSKLFEMVDAKYQSKEENLSPEIMRQYERFVSLQILDQQWKDHLLRMDHLKEGINLRAYAQRDPLVEYKNESYKMFQELSEKIEDEILRYLYLLEPQVRMEQERVKEKEEDYVYTAPEKSAGKTKQQPVRAKANKVRPNDPCPCGSGKKHKKCHGRG